MKENKRRREKKKKQIQFGSFHRLSSTRCNVSCKCQCTKWLDLMVDATAGRIVVKNSSGIFFSLNLNKCRLVFRRFLFSATKKNILFFWFLILKNKQTNKQCRSVCFIRETRPFYLGKVHISYWLMNFLITTIRQICPVVDTITVRRIFTGLGRQCPSIISNHFHRCRHHTPPHQFRFPIAQIPATTLEVIHPMFTRPNRLILPN